ncbi:MAG: redoxin domain-containing protein [Bacteroidetes bacterium]|nr:MAG: redoxin domain-containing protein [Bacteroidota bacterium]
MKKVLFFLMLTASFTVYSSNKVNNLAIGDKPVISEAKMDDVSGAKISLADVKQENGLLVLFSSNTCPFVLQWEDRYPEIKAWADKNKVGMVVLNSNHTKRDSDDSFEAMKKHAKEKGYNFYYALDDQSVVANAFGGQTTPHAFLFNSKMELVYKGAIDDSYKNAKEVKQPYLKDAITSLSGGKKIAVAETKPVGCSIKRKVN